MVEVRIKHNENCVEVERGRAAFCAILKERDGNEITIQSMCFGPASMAEAAVVIAGAAATAVNNAAKDMPGTEKLKRVEEFTMVFTEALKGHTLHENKGGAGQ